MNGTKRLMSELKNLHKDPPKNFVAKPLESNLFEWHFTVLGPKDSDFEGGVYHGKLLLPSNYPMGPPKIILLTPQGRWKINTKICLSISDFHPETWQPSWGIRTALTALIAFMPTAGKGAIGSLDQSRDARQILAQRSLAWKCTQCGAHMRQVQEELQELEDDTVGDDAETKPVDNIPTFEQTQAAKAAETPDEKREEEVEEALPPAHQQQQPQPRAPTQNTNVTSAENDFLNSVTLILFTVIGSILLKKIFAAFSNAL